MSISIPKIDSCELQASLSSKARTMVLPISNPTKSFWIEGAASPLRDFRSTPELPKTTDIVIIGSGYAGTTSAYWLHKVGWESVLSDR
jgi:hypothetical protein